MTMKLLLKRVLVFCLCLALLPVPALAFNDDGTPVTRSDFSLSFHLNADAFPEDGLAHYRDWESLLSKISLRGQMDSQSFPSPLNRVYFNGGAYLNDKAVVPFEYDAYGQFRYVRSPALGGASVHFNMYNFLQFMLKPYNYMYLPTQYLALVLYPEASVELWNRYTAPMAQVFAGEGERTVSYDRLYALCEELNQIIIEDENYKVYFFLTCLLTDLGMDWTAEEKLACWENLLNHLDPQQQGLTITQENDMETWVIGETVVYEKTADQLIVYLPDPDGYECSFELVKTEGGISAQLSILLDGEDYLTVGMEMDGLPGPDELEAQGSVLVELTGSALYEEMAPLSLQYDYSRTAQQKPYDMSLTVEMLHAETQEPCLGFTYEAAVQEMPHTVLVEREYDDQDDFFHLNESYLAEYKERFLPTLALAAAPVLLEVPSGVIGDAIAWMDANGILAFFGIE